jgi:hypothetical protein
MKLKLVAVEGQQATSGCSGRLPPLARRQTRLTRMRYAARNRRSMSNIKLGITFLLPTVFLFQAFAETPEIKKPKIVEEAINAVGLCNHWGGEESYDEERAKEIGEGVARDCPDAQKKATKALKAYPNDPDLASAVMGFYWNGNFELSKEEKERLCELSTPAFKQYFEQSKSPNPLIRKDCPEQAKKIYGN